jgi:hypothetical protein
MTRSGSRNRLFFAVWLSGLPGIAAVTWLVLPALVADRSLPMPIWVFQLAAAAQSAVLLAAAAAVGAFLAHQVNLLAPVYSALTNGTTILGPLRAQALPGVVGGIFGAASIWAFTLVAPEPLLRLSNQFPMPAAARLLYGGITEELLLRWGLMTLILWLLWRFIQRRRGTPSVSLVAVAIASSAVLFGVGHLPAASAMVGELTFGVSAYLVAANATFGLVAGWLFWRYGLESAIIAHITVHAMLLAVAR